MIITKNIQRIFAFCVKNVYNILIFIFSKCMDFMEGIEHTKGIYKILKQKG